MKAISDHRRAKQREYNAKYRGWHIDHVKPLASFDITDRDDLLKAVHYSNLQPLWAIDNYKKGKKGDS